MNDEEKKVSSEERVFRWGWKIYRNGKRKRFGVWCYPNGRSFTVKPQVVKGGERLIMPGHVVLRYK